MDSIQLFNWNINGLRSIITNYKKNNKKYELNDLLNEINAEIICFQEIKVTRNELDATLARPSDYYAFYSFSQKKSGYSGVATFVRKNKISTIAAEEGLTYKKNAYDNENKTKIGYYSNYQKENNLNDEEIKDLDSEGRCIITDHIEFILFNVYCPALRNSIRSEYKLRFHQLLQSRVERLIQGAKRKVIIVGDLNIAHQEMDHCNPSEYVDGDGDVKSFQDNPCRVWLTTFLKSNNIFDCYRYFHPLVKGAYTCWNTVTGARKNNYGTRIDYILASSSLVNKEIESTQKKEILIRDCRIVSEMDGSDHCPVVIDLVHTNKLYNKNLTLASICAFNLPEFSGSQQKMSMYFSKNSYNMNLLNPTFCYKKRNFDQIVYANINQNSKKGNMPSRKLLEKATPIKQMKIESFLENRPKDLSSSTVTSSTLSRPGDFENTPIERLKNINTRLNVENVQVSQTNYSEKKWEEIFSGMHQDIPHCRKHNEPCVIRTVLKKSDNYGRKFYVCSKPEGHVNDINARCNFFVWADKRGRPIFGKK